MDSRFKVGDRVLAYSAREPGVVTGFDTKYNGVAVLLDDGTKIVTNEDNLIPEEA